MIKKFFVFFILASLIFSFNYGYAAIKVSQVKFTIDYTENIEHPNISLKILKNDLSLDLGYKTFKITNNYSVDKTTSNIYLVIKNNNFSFDKISLVGRNMFYYPQGVSVDVNRIPVQIEYYSKADINNLQYNSRREYQDRYPEIFNDMNEFIYPWLLHFSDKNYKYDTLPNSDLLKHKVKDKTEIYFDFVDMNSEGLSSTSTSYSPISKYEHLFRTYYQREGGVGIMSLNENFHYIFKDGGIYNVMNYRGSDIVEATVEFTTSKLNDNELYIIDEEKQELKFFVHEKLMTVNDLDYISYKKRYAVYDINTGEFLRTSSIFDVPKNIYNLLNN